MKLPERSRATLAFLSLMVGAAGFSGGCATAPPVHSMRSPQANFSDFTTFAWDKAPDNQKPEQPVSILDSNIRAEIASDLTRKGYTEAAAGTNPSLVLQYETAAAEKLKSSPFRLGFGVGGYGSSGGAGMGVSTSPTSQITEGTLVLRVIDPAKNAEVWNGRVSRELGKAGPDPALIKGAVGELLQDFPKRGSAKK